MAEAAVSFALESLSSLLVQEIKLLGSAKEEVEDIKSELEIIRSFLKDADSRAAQEEEGGSNEGIKTWVKQVREEAYQIEDVIDEFSLSMAQLPRDTGLAGILQKISRFIKKLKLQHEIDTQIKEIKSSLANIRQRTQTYGLRSIYHEESKGRKRNIIPHDSRVDSLFVEDTEVVGIDSTRDKLIDWLANGSPQRSVIAVVGEGGLGKTTLARKIYNNDAVKKHFDCQAWINVGKEYIKEDLLKTILQCVTNESASGEMDKMEIDLITTLREHLKDKCYMIVFDDVWKLQFWGDFGHALPDNNKNSRIMLTTRNMGVADFCKQSSIVQVHLLQPLAPDEAWKLFCRKAFRFNTINSNCPLELKELCENIVAKCGGLPLALAAVGGLLSTKNKDVSEWRKLLDGLGSKLRSDPYLESCNRVLSEGYYDLPHHLKSCLLYFGIFPESYEIKCGRLIRLWIAEGFIQEKERPSEEVAEEYLTMLIDRSLVQVSKRKLSGRPGSCRVHDLMHEVILRKTKELGFCQVVNGEDLTHCNKIRRISAHKSTNCSVEEIKKSKVRSVLFCNVDKQPDAIMTIFVGYFKLLKVLDFENAPLEYLPKGAGKLFHLHYLSVRNTKVRIVPKSIGKLLNLLTLDLRNSFVRELPIEISNLKKLRCLLVNHWADDFSYLMAAKIQDWIGSLTDLRRLELVEVKSQVLGELRQLRQLRRLCISVKSNEDVKDLLASIDNMEILEYLTIVVANIEKETLDLQSVTSPPQSLKYFSLFGTYVKKLPDWIIKLQNLIRIMLRFEGSIVYPLAILQALPNLATLDLHGTDCDEELHFKKGWFPKLLNLHLHCIRGLKLMVIDKDAMPNLNQMWIGPCPLLTEIPIGIQYLRNFKLLIFVNMLKEVYGMIKDENWEKVTSHIPEVSVTFKKTGKLHAGYSTKYLSSLSPEEFEQLIKEVDRSKKHPNQ